MRHSAQMLAAAWKKIPECHVFPTGASSASFVPSAAIAQVTCRAVTVVTPLILSSSKGFSVSGCPAFLITRILGERVHRNPSIFLVCFARLLGSPRLKGNVRSACEQQSDRSYRMKRHQPQQNSCTYREFPRNSQNVHHGNDGCQLGPSTYCGQLHQSPDHAEAHQQHGRREG